MSLATNALKAHIYIDIYNMKMDVVILQLKKLWKKHKSNITYFTFIVPMEVIHLAG